MALFTGDTPKRTRLSLLDIFPRGTAGNGNSQLLVGSGTDVPLCIKLPTAQSVDAFDIETAAGAPLFSIDSGGNIVYLGGVAGAGMRCASVALTAANIIAMYTTPVSILPAPAAGLVLVVDSILLTIAATATAFTSGGAINLVYHGGAVIPHSSSVAAAQMTATGPTISFNLFPPPTTSIIPPAATGIDITNATGPFATGTGTATVTIWYSIIGLTGSADVS